MEYKLNSFKTYKDNWITFVLWMIVALVTMLAIGCRWNDFKAESETETAWTAEVWMPWTLNESWDAQLMPPINKDTPHDRFKELAAAYSIDAWTIRQIENHYWLKEWMVLCISIAETSGGWRGYGKTNPWNVGNNDRWDRIQYALFETWLEKIAQTLTNRYLGKIQTLWCLSNAWNCESWDDKGYRYATSTSNWEKNMSSCLWVIYGKINPSTFNIRR